MVSVCEDKKVLEMDGGWLGYNVNVLNATELIHFKNGLNVTFMLYFTTIKQHQKANSPPNRH